MPKVSVIIPTYNRAKYLPEAIDSVLNQTYQDFEIIIVDDGSTDNTEDIVCQYVEGAPERIRYLHQNNKGVSAATNNGIIESKGEYICFLDDDDYYLRQSLELRTKALNLYDADIIIGKLNRIYVATSQGKIDSSFPLKYRKAVIKRHGKFYICDGPTFFKMAINKGFFVHTSAIMFKKQFLNQIGLFDESLKSSQDIDIYFRVFSSAKNFIYIDDTLSSYRHHLNRHSNDLNRLFLDERRRYIKQIKYLNEKKFDNKLVKDTKRRICARKYKIKGISNYRSGHNVTALKNYLKSWEIYKDNETFYLLIKTLVPRFLVRGFRSIKMALASAK